MNMSFLIPILVVLAVAFILVLLKNSKGTNQTGTYKERNLMTDNEAEFFGRLVVALPDHYIFPQVAMSALLDTASSDKRTAHGDRLRIAQQRVDYVVCTKRCEVVAVVELDDRTHSRAKDQLRDARLEQGRIRTVRFQARQKPNVGAIRAAILGSVKTDVGKAPDQPSAQGKAETDTTPLAS
jgi:preprotein translocase subunit SecG